MENKETNKKEINTKEEIFTELKSTFITKDSMDVVLKKLDELEKNINSKNISVEDKDKEITEVKFWKNVFTNVKSAGDLDTLDNGDNVIPTFVWDKILTAAKKTDWVRKYGTVISANYKENIPILNTGATAYMVADGDAPTLSTINTKNIVFKSLKMAVASVISSSLIMVSSPDLLNTIYDSFGRAISKLDRELAITGSGSGEWQGLQNTTISTVTAGSGHTAITSIDYDDMINLFMSIGEEYSYNNPDMAFIMHPNTLSAIYKITEDNKHVFDVKNNTIFNIKVIRDSNMPTSGTSNPVIYFGNIPDYWVIDRQGNTITVTNAGKELVLKKQTLVYMDVLCDGHLTVSEGWAGLVLASS